MENKWTMETYLNFCKEVNDDMDEDDSLFQTARDILCCNPDLKDYIINELGETDPIKYFMNSIS